MSYNFLVNATKNRIINELKAAFATHPHFKDLEIVNKFPYEERIQQGIVVRNSTAGRVPLSADNFQGTVSSYVSVAKHLNSKSLSIEWVREDSAHLAERVKRHDVSHLFTNLPQMNVTIQLPEQCVASRIDVSPAYNRRSVEIHINGQKVMPILVDGERGEVLLANPPPTNSTVEISYWRRNISPAGIYQLEIVSGNPQTYEFQFMLDAMLEREDVIFENSDGDETAAELTHKPIFPGSLRLRENDTLLINGTDYIVDNQSGIITFLTNPTLLRGARVTAQYRTKGLSTGPFNIPTFNQANNTALPGVVIAFGRGVSIGDKHFIVVNKKRDVVAQEYSGKWDMGISLDIYAKDSHMIEEIIDITTSNLLFHRKDNLDEEGIALVDVSFGGESEQIFDEGSGDLYYTGSVDYKFLTEWILHKPLLRTVDGFDLTFVELIEESELDVIVPGMSKTFERIK